MKALSRILFPVSVLAVATAGAVGFGHGPVETLSVPAPAVSRDTVVYPNDGYRQRRTAEQILQFSGTDSLLSTDSENMTFELDTLPQIFARDTIKAPDSLRLTDPFRYKYYVALNDSLTHRQVRDSLRKASRGKLSAGDTLAALADSMDWKKLDSIYVADSTFAAKAAFAAWYAGLSKEERKKYDLDQKMARKLEEMDSVRAAREEKQAIRDSIIETTPRILETFAVPDSMQYKRMITWTVDQDFHKMKVEEPDTTYNYHFYDYPFLHKDVNATWLGVPGSPLQYYNFQNRTSETDVEFYKAQEAWAYSPGTLPQFNTKTPHTELAYYGTLFGKQAKESDNIHVYTTQNITPALNVGLLFDRYGGGGMLEKENTINKNFSFKTNYLGKKYLMNAGYIYNMVDREENGGMTDLGFVRDTVLDSRDMKTYLAAANSKIVKHTVFLDQQLRIPFEFINKIRARKDSTYKTDPDLVDRNITTAYIGHSSEFSTYSRKYTDLLTEAREYGFYNNVLNYDDNLSLDSMRVMNLDNKVFIKLQPWSDQSIVSKLNVGVGDRLRQYYQPRVMYPDKGTYVTENDFYLYAGAEGQYKNFFDWDAKARTVMLGANFGDLEVGANARFNVYPFRRAKNSPISFNIHFDTSLKNPTFYQKHIYTNHYYWNHNDFSKISQTDVSAELDIPYWKLNAKVGYALLKNNLYYDQTSQIRQNTQAMSVLSAQLRKEFVFGPLHLDNKALFQMSSNQSVVPVPTLALNLRYFFEFVVQKGESKTFNIMTMQIGVNGFFNTKWNAPAWNPNLGVFFNQNMNEYTNGPYFDVFMNIQWQRVCLFIKYQNATAGMRWPLKRQDYFSADRMIITQSGMDGLKIGVFWPFHMQPAKSGLRGPAPQSKPSSSSGGTQPKLGGGSSVKPAGSSGIQKAKR